MVFKSGFLQVHDGSGSGKEIYINVNHIVKIENTDYDPIKSPFHSVITLTDEDYYYATQNPWDIVIALKEYMRIQP